jgi:hypothetical protein
MHSNQNCGSWPASDGGLLAGQFLPDVIGPNVGASLLAKAVFQSTSKEQGNTRPLFARKPNPESAFKVHEPLRHKGYNTLRRYLRVRQNPPAYAAWRGIYRFLVTGKQ